MFLFLHICVMYRESWRSLKCCSAGHLKREGKPGAKTVKTERAATGETR